MSILLIPKNITLKNSNVAASTLNEYSSGTTYASGDKVKVSYESDGTTDRRPIEKYESTADSNSGNYPPSNPDVWSYLGPTNRWAMFDDYINTQTENSDAIEVKVTANKCSHFVLYNLDATDIEWWLYNSSGDTVKSGTINLAYSETIGNIAYKTDIIQPVNAWVFNGSIEVHINKTGDTAKCGHMSIGRAQDIGNAQFGVETGQLDFSKYETANSGYTYLKQGSWAKENKVDLHLDSSRIDRVFYYIADARSIPSVWECNQSNTTWEPLLLFGFYKKASIVLRYKISTLRLQLRGMT